MLDAKPMPSDQLPSTTGSFSAACWCCRRSPLALKSTINPIVGSVYRTALWGSARRWCVGGCRGDWHRLTKGAHMNNLLTMISAVALLTAIAGPAYADQHERTVFVTSVSFNGNLGGLTGADDKCQAEADGSASIVPSGTYLAWLSDGTDSPDTRFTKSAHPYVLPDGTKIAEDFTDLTDGSILHAINIDPTGEPFGLQRFWTGTNADGTTAGYVNLCDKWTTEGPRTTFRGISGTGTRTDKSWSTQYGSMECSEFASLVCFQQ